MPPPIGKAWRHRTGSIGAMTVDAIVGDIELTAGYDGAIVALVRIDECHEAAAGRETDRQILLVRYESKAVTTVRIATPQSAGCVRFFLLLRCLRRLGGARFVTASATHGDCENQQR